MDKFYFRVNTSGEITALCCRGIDDARHMLSNLHETTIPIGEKLLSIKYEDVSRKSNSEENKLFPGFFGVVFVISVTNKQGRYVTFCSSADLSVELEAERAKQYRKWIKKLKKKV